MNAALNQLIAQFRAAQDLAVTTLTDRLKIPRPATNRDWPNICRDHNLHNRSEIDGVHTYAHGFGIELKMDDLTIDFDWGPQGQPDGFDVWRLHIFMKNNNLLPVFSYDTIQQWIDDAFSHGELIREGALYFDPARRRP